jgi:hypothetical protein
MLRNLGGWLPGRPRFAVLLVAGLLLGAPAIAPTAAASWTAGACPTSAGVTVVVDYASLGGGIVVRCAPGRPANGLQALAQAGFVVDLVSGTPFVCHIEGQPSDQTCETYPPANAYWGYWQAARGGAWTYASAGAGSSGTAPQGAVQGWAFEAGPQAPPSVAPPAAPQTTPTPEASPTARLTPNPTPSAARPSTPPPSAAADPPQPSPSGAPPVESPQDHAPLIAAVATAFAPAGAAGARASPSGATTAGDAAPSDGPGTPPMGTLIGIGLLVVVGAGVLLARRSGAPRA